MVYSRRIKRDLMMIPVTSDMDRFVNRRMELSLANLSSDIGKKSLVKSQKDKAGGLLHFTIPIPSRAFESIFGEGGAGLQVSGYRKISFTGRSTWTDKVETAFHKQSKFPVLQMEQVYQFRIKGTIGSKIEVMVNQDSRNDIPLANRLELRYKGHEDDVLQTVEAGNTTLNLPSTQFLGYNARVQGLFGIKATAQLADVSITAIASQEKGTTETIEINAGTSAMATRVIRDVDYKKRTAYDLGRLPLYRSKSDTLDEPDKYDFLPGDKITKAILYLDDNSADQVERATRTSGICYIDPSDTLSDDTLSIYRYEGKFNEVSEDDYYLNPDRFYILFLRSVVSSNHVLAAYMEVLRQDGTVDTIGDISATPYKLKLIKPQHYTDVNHHVWEYEWRNIYYLNTNNFDVRELDIKIYKGASINNQAVNPDDPYDQDGISYLQIFGLDRGDNNAQGNPDGEIDRQADLVDPILGYLIFPSRHPFDPRFSFTTNPATGDSVYLNDTVPELYNSSSINTQFASKYYISATTQERGSSVINLNATNIIENSEVIKLGGVRLNRGTDYNIDYDFGRLTLLNDTLGINSNLSIMFEKAPFFSLARKTLLGTRLEYAPSREFNIGTTLLYKSDKTTARKPKVGEETSKIFVGDVDFDYRLENPLFTTMADALPFISATAKSYMQLSAEVARSFPNPNVDGQVFIDDFEGSKDSYQLGIYRHNWRPASRPDFLDTAITERGKIGWYNPIDQVPLSEIWPGRDVGTGETDAANVMNIHFRPIDHRVIKDTVNNVIDTSIAIEPENSWAGFMRNISQGAAAQIENSQLLELRIKGDVGVMHIDLGRISEDINGNAKLNDEDKNLNRILEDEEDVGLDGLPSHMETGYDPVTNPDPAGDDFFYDPNNINPWTVNGTEGNRDDPDGGYVPDSEDDDNDGFETVDSYFSYRVDLSDTVNDFIGFYVSGSRNQTPEIDYGWRTIRIPLRDPRAIDTMINDPSWANVWFARIWFDSASAANMVPGNEQKIQIASIELLSTTWADSFVVADSLRGGEVSFDITVVNKEISDEYYPPPGVEGYYDQTRDVVETEQSLEFTFEGLNGAIDVYSPDSGIVLAADTGLAVRKFFQAMNFMGYGKLQAYVYGGLEGGDATSDSVLFFFRMGYDHNAYYEYRTVLKPGWDPANHILIDFEAITGLKALLLNDRTNGIDSSLVRYDKDTKYLVKIKGGGQDPTLTRIQYFSMGVVNLDRDKPAHGRVWVDELRLTDVRDDVGTAARFAVSGNMSDLINYNFGYSYQDAYYRGVSSATRGGAADNLGSGQTRKNYNFGGSMRLEKFFPRALELQMPLSFNWSQSVQEPLLRSGTDIIVPEDLKSIETSVTVTKGFRVSQRFNKKTRNPLFTFLLNRLSSSFNYNITKGHSATQPMFIRERHDTKAGFDLSVKKPPTISPLKWMSLFRVPFGLPKTRLYLYPTRLDLSGNLGSSYSRSINQNSSNPTNSKLDFSGNMNMSFKLVESFTGAYNFTTNRDLRDPETVNLTFNPRKFKLGVEQSYSQAFRASYSPTIFNFLTHKFNYSANYGDTYRRVSDTLSYHSANSRVNADASFTLKHESLIGSNKKRSRGSGGTGRRADTTSSSMAFNVFGLALKGIRHITDAIKPISGKLSTGRTLTYPGLADKASQKFRLGFTEDPGVASVASSSTTIRASKSITKSLSASSGMDLFAGISVDVSYGRSTRETFDATPTKTITENWPDLKFNLRSIKGLWYFGKLMNALSPNSRYSRTKDTKKHTNALYPFDISTKEAFSPLISFTINPLRSMRTTFRYETGSHTNTKISEVSGQTTNITERSNQSFAVSWTYSFSNPSGVKLPLLGRIKFQSNLSVTLDVNYSKSYGENANANNNFEFVTNENKTSLTVRPSANYSFSSTVKGGLSARWQDSNDITTRRKSHTRELGLWVELRF